MNFHGYEVHQTGADDIPIIGRWVSKILDVAFWLKQEDGRETFMVIKDEPLAVFQTEQVNRQQVRLHFQANPTASRKKILQGITMMVPLIEQALSLRGVKAIFFTSKSLAMVTFMEKRMKYRLAMNTDGGEDGAVMFKEMPDVRS